MSLAKCLKKIGLAEHESAVLRGLVKDHTDDGYKPFEAAQRAIAEYIKDLEAEAQDLIGQVEKALGIAPKSPDIRFSRKVDKTIEARLEKKLTENYEAAVVEYKGIPDTYGGKILNTDLARELSPDYQADRSGSAHVHEPASTFIKRLYADRLKEPVTGGVMFTAGGTGAGKSTGIDKVPEARALERQAQILFDTNMNGLESGLKKIEQALASGRDVTIVYTYRDPIDSLVNGSLPRAERMGRTVPLNEHADTHVGASASMRKVRDKYKGNPRVKFVAIDNSRRFNKEPILVDLDTLPVVSDNGLEAQLQAALDEEFRSGRISEKTYLGSGSNRDQGEETPPGGGGEGVLGGPVGVRAQLGRDDGRKREGIPPDERVAFSRKSAEPDVDLGDAGRFLQPAERAKLRKATAQKFVDTITTLPSAKEMAAVAFAGRAKRGWYKGSAEALVTVFGADATRFAALLAAMSPQTSVENNLINALHTWKNWVAAGRPRTQREVLDIMGASVQGDKGVESVLGAWRNNAFRALTASDPGRLTISGPKVNSFFRNLIGVADEVTNDAWMANYALVDQTIFSGGMNVAGKRDPESAEAEPGKGAGYLAMSARVREAADTLTKLTGETWTPAEVQETIWSWAKTLYELQDGAGEKRGARQLLRDKAVTDELIRATPDFRTLFNEPTNAAILKDAGLKAGLGRLGRENAARARDEKPGPRRETAPFDRGTEDALLDQAAARLEKLREQRREKPAEVSFSRKQVESPQFKAWFGKSKIVDLKGRPQIFYHGTASDVSTFEADKALSGAGNKRGKLGHFFAKDLEVAESYARVVGDRAGGGGNIVPVYLKLENPLEWDAWQTDDPQPSTEKLEEMVAQAKAEGRDGLYLRGMKGENLDDPYTPETIAIVFDSKNVKSAIGNSGDFSDSRHIAFSRRAAAAAESPQFRAWFKGSKTVDADGKPQIWHHGTTEDFRIFDSAKAETGAGHRLGSMGHWFTLDTDAASEYASHFRGRSARRLEGEVARAKAKWQKSLSDEDYAALAALDQEAAATRFAEAMGGTVEGANVIPVFLRLKNPLVVNGGRVSDTQVADIISRAERDGRDGVIFQDMGGENLKTDGPATVAVVFDNTNIKSVFNRTFGPSADISFSRKQTETPEFKRWFGGSAVVDGEGKPLVVYHGTSDAGFSTFDLSKIDPHHTGFFFTSDPSVAETYGSEKAVELRDAPEIKTVSALRKYLATQPAFEGRRLQMLEREQLLDDETDTPRLHRSYELYWEGGGGYRDVGEYRSGDFERMRADAIDALARGPIRSGTYSVYLSFQKPLVIDAKGNPWMLVPHKNRDMQITEIAAIAKKEGYDGLIVRDTYDSNVFLDTPSDVYVAFDPSQIKSATGNNGQFDPANPDIRFSRKAYTGPMTAAQEKAARAVGLITDPVTVQQRMQGLKANLGLRIKQGLVDQFAAIKDLSPAAYLQARMSKATDGVLEAMLYYGKPFMRDGVYDVKITPEGGFAKVMADLGGEHDRFLMWVAAMRAKRLKAEGKENLFTDQSIAALETLDQGRQTKFAKALQQLNAYNESVLQIALDSGLIDQDAYDLMKSQPYVPFYRVMQDTPGGGMPSGLKGQQFSKKLKGGTNALKENLLENIMQNWSHVLGASARNRAMDQSVAAAEAASIAYPVTSDTKGAVKFQRAGKTTTYMIEDPYLFEAVSAVTATMPGWMKPFSDFKRILTIGVTASPTFKIRNLIRDSLSAIGQSDLSANPLKNVAQGIKATSKKNQTFASMLASGGIIRFGAMIEGSNRTERTIEKAMSGVVLDKNGFKKFHDQMLDLWDAYNELGDRAESANRAALYEQLIARGKSHAEASFMARDLMDFSMSGRWEVVKFLANTVPFLNARLQGLYKLGRAAAENPKRVAYMVSAVSMASIALALAYGDDEDWKKREDHDRDAYWWFKIGGTAFRIPKPFEIGAMGTLAERTFELMVEPEMTGRRYRERLGHMVGSTFSMNPTPQIVKPFMDIYANRDSFTNRPIETMGMDRLRPQDRIAPNTTTAAKWLGELGLPDPGQLVQGRYAPLSPVQVDHLVRGYFGWLGVTTSSALEYGLRPMTNAPARPAMQLRDVFVAGNFMEGLPSGSSRYVTQMYKQADEIEQAYASHRDALKRGDKEQALEILQDNPALQAQHKLVLAIRRQMTDLNSDARSITSDREMSPQVKRERLNQIAERRNELAKRLQ